MPAKNLHCRWKLRGIHRRRKRRVELSDLKATCRNLPGLCYTYRVFPILALLFILVPAVEIAVIIRVGQSFGLGATLALILVTAVVGAWLAKSQGRDVMQKLQSSFGGDAKLGQTLIEGLLIFVAGITLLAPGFITDAVGIAFLIPPIRQFLARRLAASGWLKQRVAPVQFSSWGPSVDSDYDPPPPGVIDVDPS